MNVFVQASQTLSDNTFPFCSVENQAPSIPYVNCSNAALPPSIARSNYSIFIAPESAGSNVFFNDANYQGKGYCHVLDSSVASLTTANGFFSVQVVAGNAHALILQPGHSCAVV
jgi:hypothetical protein